MCDMALEGVRGNVGYGEGVPGNIGYVEYNTTG